jgi:hypothetical protein
MPERQGKSDHVSAKRQKTARFHFHGHSMAIHYRCMLSMKCSWQQGSVARVAFRTCSLAFLSNSSINHALAQPVSRGARLLTGDTVAAAEGCAEPPAEGNSHGDPWREYRVPERVIRQTAACIDVVTADCHNANCFTKGYAHYIKGTGSVLATTRLEILSTFPDWGHRELVSSHLLLLCFSAVKVDCLAENRRD